MENELNSNTDNNEREVITDSEIITSSEEQNNNTNASNQYNNVGQNNNSNNNQIAERDIAISIILTIVTCGLYGLYWFICLTDEVKTRSGEESAQSGGIALILTIITCGIYGLYWAYKIGKDIAVAQQKAGITVKDNSVLYLILDFLGLSIVNYALMQNDLNEITRSKRNTTI